MLLSSGDNDNIQACPETTHLGELAEGYDLGLATHQLVVLIDGLSAERVLYQDRVTVRRQVEMLDLLLRSFRGGTVVAGAGEGASAAR